MINSLAIPKYEIDKKGFSIINHVYKKEEIAEIIKWIDKTSSEKENFRKHKDLFAIRQFLKEIPETHELIFNNNLRKIINEIFGNNYFIIKSIYFDKPETSNWYVAYHQDLTISVKNKVALDGFINWTKKQNLIAVQPPIEILENIYTIRIHLDDTDENNGALKVIENSHLREIYRPESVDWQKTKETICPVKSGGIMLMKPLTLHSSNRTINNQKRRVLHIEFSNITLPDKLEWAEGQAI